MGRFDGLLLLSDYDDTLAFTSQAFREGRPAPAIPARNIEAIRYFMAEGGLFSVATGRPLASFLPFAAQLPMNAPGVVNGGAGLYDFEKRTYLRTFFLPDGTAADLQPVLDRFPEMAAKAFHLGEEAEVIRPNEWARAHTRLTRVETREIGSLAEVGPQATKLLFEGTPELLAEVQGHMRSIGLEERYEIACSSAHILEITGKGVHKGNMALALAALLGVDRRDLCCAGDQAIDVPMLLSAGRAFAPSNAIGEVLSLPGVTVVGHCQDGAVADIVAILEKK